MSQINFKGKYFSKKAEFEKILKYSEPSDLYYINKYMPDDFEWTEENFKNLSEQIKNQT